MTRSRVTRHRRPGTIPGRRAAWAAAVALLILGATAAPARSDTGQQVVAGVVGQSATSSASVGQLNASGCPKYSGPNYDPDDTPFSDAWSVGTLLGCLTPPITVTDQTSVIIGSSQLGPDDLDGSVYPNGELPVVFSGGTYLEYERPSRGPGDDPASEDDTEANGAPLTLSVFTGPALAVTITPSDPSVAAGGQLSFTPAVSGGSPTDFSWTFSGGAPASDAETPTVTFDPSDTAGSYQVTLTATNPATGAAGVGSTTIQVTGAAPPPASTTTTGTTTAPPQPTTGTAHTPAPPRHRHGSGTASTPSTTSTTSTTTSTSQTPAAATTSTTESATTPTTSTMASTPATATATSSAEAPAIPAGTAPASSPAAPPSSARTPSRGHGPSHTTPSPQPPHPSAPLVSGRLIADVTLLPANRSPLVHTAAAATGGGASASVAHGSPASWPMITGAAAFILALLGLGAARELRGR